jgi:hypothetical protein
MALCLLYEALGLARRARRQEERAVEERRVGRRENLKLGARRAAGVGG